MGKAFGTVFGAAFALMGLGLLAACTREAEGPAPSNAVAGEVHAHRPTWSSAQKLGIGTSYEAYRDGAFSDAAETGAVSKVWFSLTDKGISEVMWGLIHEAQLREMRVVASGGPEGVVNFKPGTVEWLHVDPQGRPLAPAYRLTQESTDGGVVVRKEVWSDPDRQALIVDLYVSVTRPELQVHVLVDPALGNTGSGDRARVLDERTVHAFEGDAHLVARLERGERALVVLAGEDFASDPGVKAGDVAGMIAVPLDANGRYRGSMVIGFGTSLEAAQAEVDGVLAGDLSQIYARYVQEWEGYLTGLEHLPTIAAQAGDGGALAHASALVMKVMEDKTHAGALIASLSNPWGETADASTYRTGYKGVWPRDFYQVAMAFLALGDEESAATAFRYLPKVQVRADTPGNTGATGWFLQKSHVDGTIEWVGVQLDQTAMPVMLGERLWRAGVIGDAEMAQHWAVWLKPAADFLATGGRPGLDWNTEFAVKPGLTQQERWEEQWGYSPSTLAAVIAGLVAAAELADAFGEGGDAARYLAVADDLEGRLEAMTFATGGQLPGEAADGRYALRITQNEDPNDRALIDERNGLSAIAEDLVVDGGFLELVRYGVRAADAAMIRESLPELDDETRDHDLRVKYTLGGHPGWRRYGHDGYGEDQVAGTGYAETGQSTPGQRGRVWPHLTGERGHYEIAGGTPAETVRAVHVRAVEAFANRGLMLPEQVWDGVGVNPFGYEVGEGTDSATPLAWTHAEYVKLLRSLADGAVWDRVAPVAARYGDRERPGQ
jgi:glucoamylase